MRLEKKMLLAIEALCFSLVVSLGLALTLSLSLSLSLFRFVVMHEPHLADFDPFREGD